MRDISYQSQKTNVTKKSGTQLTEIIAIKLAKYTSVLSWDTIKYEHAEYPELLFMGVAWLKSGGRNEKYGP